MTFSLYKNDVNVASKSNSYKFLVVILKVTNENNNCGSVSQRYGSADPDPYQHVTDPQHAIQYKYTKIECWESSFQLWSWYKKCKFGSQSCPKIQKQKFEYDGVYPRTLDHKYEKPGTYEVGYGSGEWGGGYRTWSRCCLTSSTGLSGRGVGLTGSYSESSPRLTSVTTLNSSWSWGTKYYNMERLDHGYFYSPISTRVPEPEIHRLNAEGHYAEFLNAESPIPNWTECRIGLNAEFSNAEWDLMPKSRMPNWTEGRMWRNAPGPGHARLRSSVAEPGCFFPDPRSWFFIHPGPRIQQQHQKRRKNFFSPAIFCSHKYQKL